MIKKKIMKHLAGILSLAMVVTLFPANALGTVQAADAPQPALHYDMTHADGKLKDVTNNGNDGALKGFTDADFSTSGGSSVLNFDESAKYVEIPSGVINGESFTIEAAYTNNKQSAAWLFTLGTTVGSHPNVKNYFFVAPNHGDFGGKMLAAIKKEDGELRYDSATAIAGETEGKNIVTAVFDNGDVTYYLNGLKTNTTASGYSIQDILSANSTDTCIGYIGKSLYSPDPYFKGSLLDFKIYETALTDAQVQQNHAEVAAPLGAAATAKINGMKGNILPAMLNGNADKDHILSDLSFPAELDGVSLEWTSSDTEVISEKGKITPKDATTPVTITVKAVYNRRGEQTQTYQVQVLSKKDVEYEALTIPNMDNIKGNITLPEVGKAGSEITWTSSNEAVISSQPKGEMPAGVVTRQNTDTKVKLTATIKLASGNRTKDFNVTVKKKADVGTMTDYIFAYFIGDGAGQEKIFFASSRDGLNWEELNDAQPVMESEIGTKGLRDPFIIRSPEGDKFYLIATDLQIAAGEGWTAAQERGSQAIMVWESDDLVNWTDQRMATISAGIEAGCTWAPEIFYDDATGEYMVFWSSKIKSLNYDKQRVYYCKTRDFYTFTEPQVWIDESHSTIDTTVVQDVDGTYYRFSKNEDNGAKYIYLESSNSLLGTWEMVNPKILNGIAVEGPCCFAFNEDDIETAGGKWCLLQDDFGGGGYFPMITEDLSVADFTRISAKLPSKAKPRHGTVMNITAEEYKAIKAKWGTVTLSEESVPSYVSTGYTLPAKADVMLDDEKYNVDVNWDQTASDFLEAGTVNVTGTIPSLSNKKISKTIEVISDKLIYLIDSGVGEWNDKLKESGFYKAVKAKINLRNELPDQLYEEGSWGFVNDADYTIAGNRTNAEDSIYTNGWWAKDAKDGEDAKYCEYIIPLENGSYMATGYFAEWWSVTRPVKFYAQYTNASGENVESEVKVISLSGQNARQKAAITFEVAGVTDRTEVHFYAKNADGNKTPAPVIAGLAIETYVPVTDVTLDKAELTLKKGDTATLKATVKPDGSNKKKAAWASDNEEVASVVNGKVTAKAAGTAKITATVEGKTATCTVTVLDPPAVIAVNSVTLTPNQKAATLVVGRKTVFGAVVSPNNATNKTVTWNISDSKVATIVQDNTGKVTVTAKKAGTAKLTATAGGKTATCIITVVNPKLSLKKVTLGKGETLTLKVSGNKGKAVWSSSNKKAVSVKNGKIKALKTGSKAVSITAKVDGMTLTCKVTVKNAPKKISLNKKSTTLKKGKTFNIKVKFPKNTASNQLTYKIDKKGKKVVSVDSKGKVKAKKKGKATITVTTFNKKKATIKITVK